METLSGDDTRSRRGAAENHLVHWVFPEPATTLLESSTVVLGRGEQCTPPLAGQRVSRRHAEIRRSGPLAILIDLGSTNGVFVNGERAERAVLKVGDVVRLGDCVGVVSEASGVTAQPQTFGEIAPGLYGGSCLRAAYGPLEKAGQLSVVLEGETGTGKEVFAKAAHRVSGRDPFVAVNCAALPESLAEAELFGYRQGAFTGASRSQPGYLRAASGGTLLLDEIVELPMAIQTKLLRAVEMGEVSPLGEHKPVRIDVRWIAAAQQPLGAAVEKGRFRADLLARLDGLTLRIPPLRERKEDILPLFLHFLGSENPRFQPSVSARFVEALCLHDWPLNVRELLQLAKRLVVFCADEPRLQRSHLPQSMLVKTEAAPSGARHSEEIVIDQGRRARRRQAQLQDLERLVHLLERHNGNVQLAARELNISRQRAYRLLDLDPGVDVERLRRK